MDNVVSRMAEISQLASRALGAGNLSGMFPSLSTGNPDDLYSDYGDLPYAMTTHTWAPIATGSELPFAAWQLEGHAMKPFCNHASLRRAHSGGKGECRESAGVPYCQCKVQLPFGMVLNALSICRTREYSYRLYTLRSNL